MRRRQISLDGIPEPVARAIEVVVQIARRFAATDKKRQGEDKPMRELPKWEGQVIGTLSRSAIYDDV
jgi:hypothetical protein